MVIGIPGRVKYMKGSAVVPEAGGLRYILNILGTNGEYSGAFALDLAKRWPIVEQSYKHWFRSKFGNLVAGEIQSLTVQSDTIVVNMLADDDGRLNLEALAKCLNAVSKTAAYDGASVHMPQLGNKRNSKAIEKQLKETLIKAGINITIYQK